MYDPNNPYQTPNPNAWVWQVLKVFLWFLAIVGVIACVTGAAIFVWVFAKKFAILILIIAVIVVLGWKSTKEEDYKQEYDERSR